jgi:hypothetical protein
MTSPGAFHALMYSRYMHETGPTDPTWQRSRSRSGSTPP